MSLQVLNDDGYSSTIKDKILTIDVRPGWRQGTRITFEKEGDQVKGKVLTRVSHQAQELGRLRRRWCPGPPQKPWCGMVGDHFTESQGHPSPHFAGTETHNTP